MQRKPRIQFQISPLDGAQYASISSTQTSNQGKQCEVQKQKQKKATHLYTEKKGIFEQQVKTVIIPIPTY